MSTLHQHYTAMNYLTHYHTHQSNYIETLEQAQSARLRQVTFIKEAHWQISRHVYYSMCILPDLV